jgi:hypothetical protein
MPCNLTNYKFPVAIFCLVTLFCLCKQVPEKSHDQNVDNDVKQSHAVRTQKASDSGAFLQINYPQLPRVYGYYFVITGDFDGNGTKDTLTEHFFSSLENRETSKWYDSIDDYDQLVEVIIQKDAQSFIICNDTCAIDTLRVASDGQSFGLAYMKNEGDLNGDGSDEVSYVVNFTDWSQLNTWYIMTYKNGSWRKLYTFPIWEWQLPALPYREYAVSGAQNSPVQLNGISDTLDDIESFEGLVKKISTGIVQVIFRNENNEVDTMLVNLK